MENQEFWLIVNRRADGTTSIVDSSGTVRTAQPGKGMAITITADGFRIMVEGQTDEERMLYWLEVIRTQPGQIIARIDPSVLRTMPVHLTFPVHILASGVERFGQTALYEAMSHGHRLYRIWRVAEEYEAALHDRRGRSDSALKIAMAAKEVQKIWEDALHRAKSLSL